MYISFSVQGKNILSIVATLTAVFACVQAAWHGELAALPVFGDGKNVLPTIHISDLAR